MMDPSKEAFYLKLRYALDEKTGFSAGKLGYSEQAFLHFPELFESAKSYSSKLALTSWIRVHAHRQSGAFPKDSQFLKMFCEKFRSYVEYVDFLAIAQGWESDDLHVAIRYSKKLNFLDLEPNRSSPYDRDNCYLPLLEGKKLLIINSIGDILQERANKEMFEAVWANIRLPWFYPRNVTSVTFPFIYDESVQAKHIDVWEIYELILKQIDNSDYDIALIGAGCLGIPIAAHIKKQGRVGISLGAHLQVLFGVYGNRWARDRDWRERYINDAWIRSPKERTPRNRSGLPDDASYW